MEVPFRRKLKARLANAKGFSLIECVMAMVITMIGVLATVALMAVGIRMQVVARDSTAANAFARAKLEQLQNYQPTAPQRTPGGSVDPTNPITNYTDVIDGRYRRLWRIETGGSVPASTQRITIVVVAEIPGVLIPDTSIVTLVPAS